MFSPGIIQYTTPPTYLLDTVTGATFACSLRKLKTGVTLAIRVRRSSDSTEQDIGFSGAGLDTVSLLLFCAATNGFVTKFYDQSGNGNDLIQATPANQPQIVTTGVLTTTDGTNLKPAVQYTNSSDHFMTLPSGTWNGATAISFIGVWNIDTSASPNAGVFAPSNSSGTGIEIISNDSSNNKLRFNGSNRISNGAGLFTDDVHFISEVYADGTATAGYQNNSASSMSSSAAMPALNYNGLYGVARYSSSGNDTTMKMQEIIGYSTNKVSVRSTIYTDISTYYG